MLILKTVFSLITWREDTLQLNGKPEVLVSTRTSGSII